jgi:hypothetical protein
MKAHIAPAAFDIVQVMGESNQEAEPESRSVNKTGLNHAFLVCIRAAYYMYSILSYPWTCPGPPQVS